MSWILLVKNQNINVWSEYLKRFPEGVVVYAVPYGVLLRARVPARDGGCDVSVEGARRRPESAVKIVRVQPKKVLL